MVTSALPYANGPLHIGHISGAYLPADIYVRYRRLVGDEVAFVCGSDENGAPITIRAKQENISPQKIVDKYHAQMKDTFEKLDIDFDIFYRTSTDLHHKTAQDFFLDLYNKGIFKEIESEQYYDEEYKQFLADRYIKGECPKCGNENAYGDQCERCGTSLSPLDLINPVSTLSGEKPSLKKTTHWYLPLENDEVWLREYLLNGQLDGKKHHNFSDWKKNVLGQVKSWLDEGLQSRAVTRDLDWGVPVPPQIPNAKNKKLYVWLDAPIGYISATKKLALEGKIKDWKPFWKDENTALIHFIGKDNIVFHTIIFPSILKAKEGYILPYNVPSNEFMNLEGHKISTSRNWAIWAHEIVESFPNQIDAFRYVLCANMPENKDAEFSWLDFQNKVNNELVASLGNFVNRVMVLNKKYYKGVVAANSSILPKYESEAQHYLKNIQELIAETINHFKFRDALDLLMKLSRNANKFLTIYEPWKLMKKEEKEAQAVLFVATQLVAQLSILSKPFLPQTARKIEKMLAIGELAWKDLGNLKVIPQNHTLGENTLLFKKIEDEFIAIQTEKLIKNITTNTKNYKAVKKEITYTDFDKLDIRIGTILDVKKVENADKLLELIVDLGFEKRTIVSGIAMDFEPSQIKGKQVQVLVNLAPRKIRGVVSKGMILFAEDLEGKLHFVSPPADVEDGSTVA